METAAKLDFNSMQAELRSIVTAITAISKSVEHITDEMNGAYASSTVGEMWARSYGEIITIKDSCKVLGVCYNTMKRLINDGEIDASPDGRVLTRSAAKWANSNKPRHRWERE